MTEFPLYTDMQHPAPPNGITASHWLAIDFLAAEIRAKGYRRILSLGAGNGECEAALRAKVPGVEIIATDRDTLDFRNPEKSGVWGSRDIDLAYFMGSSYVLSSGELAGFLRYLRWRGIRNVIDFNPACHGITELPWMVTAVVKARVVEGFKAHGYTRTRGKLRRIYREAGWSVKREVFNLGSYRHVAVLEAPA
jgi:hypothetical protein